MANSISGKDGKREMICSFCGRSQSQVDQLIIGPGVNICKDCIDMCYSALYKDGNVPEPPRATPERRAAASRGHSGVDPLADVNIMTPAEIKAGLDQYVIGQDDAKRVLAQNDPNHPWLKGGWPKNPSIFHRLNPFARSGDRSNPPSAPRGRGGEVCRRPASTRRRTPTAPRTTWRPLHPTE